MKICPKCNTEYIDETLEFCLEDGSKLSVSSTLITSNSKTAVINNNFPSPLADNFENSKPTIVSGKETEKITNIKEKVTYQSTKVIEIAPVIVALIHNYWQWLYLSKTYYGSAVSFLTSWQFSVWLSLLIVGLITGVIALKYGKFKGYAITGLVVLAINLLLSIVPTR